jgi:hypothetical protein
MPYVIFWQSSLLEKKRRFGYTFWVVDSQIFLQIDMSTGVVSLCHCAPRQERKGSSPGETNLRFCRRGTVFAASRCAGWDEAGTLRVPVSSRDQRVRRQPKNLAARDDTRILPQSRQSCFRTKTATFKYSSCDGYVSTVGASR